MSEQFGFHTQFQNQTLFVQLNPFDKEIIQKYCAIIEPPNCYVEIGTDEGGSAYVARDATRADIYTIDCVKKYIEIPNINFITDKSVVVAKTWNKPIGVLFIDGNHTEVKQDFLAWEKYVVKGGYILFHDYIEDPTFSVIKDCNDIFFDNGNYELIYKPKDRENTRILIVKKR